MNLKNSYLFIDCGNTNIKAGIYDCKTKKVNEIHFISNTQSISKLIKLFKTIKQVNITKIYIISTLSSNKTNNIVKQLQNIFKTNIKLITINDFKNKLDFKNIKKEIGTDILALGLYGSTIKPKCAIFNLGTVYTVMVMNGNKYESVLLIPSVTKGLDNISKHTSIPNSFIPTIYNKQIGLNTKDCFASGANLLLEGLVDNICKKHNIKSSNVFITGGDCNKYLNLNKKYKVIDNLTLKAISLLVK